MFSVGRFLKKLNQDAYLSYKYIGTVIFLLVLPIIFLSFVFYGRIQNIIEKEISHSYEQVLNQYIVSVNNKLSIYRNLLDTISTNGIVLDVFSRQDQYKLGDTIDLCKKLSREIDTLVYAKNPREINDIMLYALYREFPSDGRHISNIKLIADERWYKNIENQLKTVNCFAYVTDGLKISLISFTKPIFNYNTKKYNDFLGFVKIDVISSQIFNIGSIILIYRRIYWFVRSYASSCSPLLKIRFNTDLPAAREKAAWKSQLTEKAAY